MTVATRQNPSEEEILSQLTPVFREVLENEELVLTPETTSQDVDGWDSFTHTRLIAAIEERYDIRFRLKEILKFRNVGEMCRAVVRTAR